MSTLITTLFIGVGYTHCGVPMDWDVLRASYVCGICGAAR